MRSFWQSETITVVNQLELDRLRKSKNKYWQSQDFHYQRNANCLSLNWLSNQPVHMDWNQELCKFLVELARIVEGKVKFVCENETPFTIVFSKGRVRVEYIAADIRTIEPNIMESIAEGDFEE